MPKTFLIDGSALAYRAFFAAGPGPAYAYTSSLLSLIERESPDYALVAMDTGKPTFRHVTYEPYKATRQKTPPELIKQLPMFERIARAFGYPVYGLDGFEADDVIGTLAVQAAEKGHDVYIVTGDKDFMQIVGDKVSLYNPQAPGSEPAIQGREAVKEKFNCRPDQVRDVLALMGDSSDNIPGVPKVGEKTATKLIAEYEGLDDIYAHIDDIKPPGVQKRLREGKDSAYLSYDLVTIRLDAPVELSLEDLVYNGPDFTTASELLVELDFPSLVSRLGTRPETMERGDYRVVTDQAMYADFLKELHKAKEIVFDTETTSIDALRAELVGLSFVFEPGVAWYLPANLEKPIFGPGDRGLTAEERAASRRESQGLFDEELPTSGTGLPDNPLVPPEGSDLSRFLADLKPVLESDGIALIGQNLKYDLHVLARYGILPSKVGFDTMLASYVLEAHQSQHNLDFLALKHLGLTKIPTSDLIGKGQKQISMWDVPVEKCGEYACEDVDATERLYALFSKRLEESSVASVFRDIEIPCLRVLETMERHGVLVDVPHLKTLSKDMTGRVASLEDEIQAMAGETFNVASPRQLAEVLFEKMKIHEELGIKRIKKTKSGYSTDASVLESLAAHPLPAKVLEYRQLAKLKSTYVDVLPTLVHPASGRIHTSFNQAVASTGRLSSSDPNLQNIPVRTDMGRQIRKAFIAEEGYKILAADYSQVELRVMAHLTGDPGLRSAFRDGEDIHRRTAALIFSVEPADVTADMRARAKTINFGILYGMGAQRLAREIKISMKEAASFIEAYFKTFPAVKEWIETTRDTARETGSVTTITGRTRRVENIDSGDPRLAANARNVAINTPIQGSAADLIKIAMVRVHDELSQRNLRTRMILQVHDELVFECPEGEIDEVRRLAEEQMSGAMTLEVPLVVDVGVGSDWLEAH